MQAREDVTETLIEKALEQNAQVEFVKENKELEKMGDVGAILRF
jgi:peptide subunit release factor 1 (eRF1)